jgi:hypothetical protein
LPLSSSKAIEQAKLLYETHTTERRSLDAVRRYWKGQQSLPAVIPASAPEQVRAMARIARVNMCAIVVDTLAQSTFVDGFRSREESENEEIWSAWQANRLDARQTGIHRAAFAYGASYAVVLPGDSEPVLRGVSPRALTAVYGEDPDWPMWALERLGRGLWRLYDDEAVYYLSVKEPRFGVKGGEFDFIERRDHGLGVTPVIRFLDAHDLDSEDEVEADLAVSGDSSVMALGQVAPLFALQDQIDLTTFGLLVAQHYSAFRQRYILGWVAQDETEKMMASASQLWTFEDTVDEEGNEIRIGEFSQTDLKGYIDSRDATLRHAAALSQTPVHELTGTLINMAAEALAAAEAGKDRKVNERQTLLGESHEQMMWLAGRAKGVDVSEDAQVVWRDTSARAFAATVDALGKLVQMLGIPPQELWERVPGATRQDVARWKAAAERGDSFAFLSDMLERQATNGSEPAFV